jgi:S-formylglutathione hydrolase FrmB
MFGLPDESPKLMKLRILAARVFLLLFISTFSLLSACHHTLQTYTDHPRLATGVKMLDISFHSAALGREMPYRVFLPANPVAGQESSVVYLLHGNFGGFRDWSNNSDIAQYAQHGLILVMPEGNSSYYMNAVKAKPDKYQDYITKDLIADVETRFPVRKDRGGRAIVGVSMGGFAAIEYALARPDLFVFAGALSPAIDVPGRRFNWRHADQWWRFRTIFGPLGSKERQARDPFMLVQSADPQVTPYIYMTAGGQEALLGPNRRFAAQLRKRNFMYEFHTKPGGHNWPEWNTQLPGCFTSLLTHLSTKTN